MEGYKSVLIKCKLFENIAAGDIKTVLDCLQAKTKVYGKNDYIFQIGQNIEQVGIVLSGSVLIERLDYWGNRTILTKVTAGEMFGEAICCADVSDFDINASAAEKSEIMFIDYKRIITVCSAACVFHTHLIDNMLKILAEKNIMLTNKIGHLSRRTIREKLLSYLSLQAMAASSQTFDIMFNRQELADYLAVDRSAMSAELGKLRDEGILEFKKNHFSLKVADDLY